MYKKIRAHQTVRTLYAERLIDSGVITPEWSQSLSEGYRDALDQGRVITCPLACPLKKDFIVDWRPYKRIEWTHPADTRLSEEQFSELSKQMLRLPGGFQPHSRVEKIWAERKRMAEGNQLIDWGFAENLAYASLLSDGYPVRISGQDSGRGTFFHRHAVVHNQLNGDSYVPLQNLSPAQADFVVIDSLLSEEAVLGYEYGYATAEPNSLTVWEAQFGDFANGAQVVIDQFITSGWEKWGLLCGLVMLLPHGYEGQGAEHSSARLERYLRLCANHNIQVCSPTTPAQVFHMLRRQMIRPYRSPLIVMSPKSLLRNRLATSPKQSFIDGEFQPVIGEIDKLDPNLIQRLIMCTGKVYYDLLEARRSRGMENVAIIRIEQLYPFPQDDFQEVIAQFPNIEEFIWCQEEPQNQGAWDQIKHRFHTLLKPKQEVFYVGRTTASAPAVGYRPIHLLQQETLINEALTGHFNPRMNPRSLLSL
jgi:2-oxoglutarate dehydrogenase E1 component